MGYLERLDTYREDMIRTLGESIAFPSVNSDPVRAQDGSVLPFGRGVHDALIHMLGVGSELGFESNNVDNYAGYIDCKAAGEYEADAKNVGGKARGEMIFGLPAGEELQDEMIDWIRQRGLIVTEVKEDV